MSYHDVASSVVDADKLLRKDHTLEHSDSGSDFVNAELRKSIALASGIEQTLSLRRQRLSLRREQQNNAAITQHTLPTHQELTQGPESRDGNRIEPNRTNRTRILIF